VRHALLHRCSLFPAKERLVCLDDLAYRNRNIPFPVSTDVLARIGVLESLIPRTFRSLQTLDLINNIGNPTETLEGIRLSPEAEYKDRLAAWLRRTYSGIFDVVDPTEDDPIRVRDAFRGYRPIGQQERMVILFEGLCKEAGLIPEKSSVKKVTAAVRSTSKVSVKATHIKAKSAKHKLNTYGLPPAIAGLMEGLPEEGWTVADRTKFLKTFESVLDFSIPIVKEKKDTAEK
jgi:hypothetical protein